MRPVSSVKVLPANSIDFVTILYVSFLIYVRCLIVFCNFNHFLAAQAQILNHLGIGCPIGAF